MRERVLWGELLRRVAAADLLDSAAGVDTSARRITLADGRVLCLTSWAAVLAVLDDAAVQGGGTSSSE